MDVVAKMDELGRPFWIVVMILGFVFFWPVGLAVLAYLIWSRRMCHMHHGWDRETREEWRARKQEWKDRKREWRDYWRGQRDELRSRGREMADEMHEDWFRGRRASRPSGNAAFDDYKAETLKRLEEEQDDFTEFLDRLRKSKDQAEFDQFMADRRRRTPDVPATRPETDEDRPAPRSEDRPYDN